MAKLIGSVRSSNFGENLFITKVQEFLDDHYIIYWNRQIFGREFDVCILMPGKGILVVELKGWREENILRIENSDTIIIKTDEGEIPATPQKQARGYRFAIERHIRQNIGKYPLVFQMVCLPQVSKSFYHQKRLDVVLDEPFTILKEDLEDTNSFYKKIDQALSEANHWKRTPFDSKTMLEVRHIFECDIEPDENDAISDEQNSTDYHNEHDYSRFYFLGSGSSLDSVLDEMISQYIQGCKLYGVVATSQQLTQVAMALDAALTEKGLVRNRDSIELDFERSTPHNPEVSENMTSFMAFHCSLSVLTENISDLPQYICIHNGKFSSQEKAWLENLSKHSQFNSEQYFVEHADPEKNVVIRAGAGTGKTYTMVSRIGFICYTQSPNLQNMADRIVMITFTNEAADQMKEKLKSYFENCYLLTSQVDYLTMISHIDHMQISTIHSYAKKVIAQLGTEFGYGIDISITSSEFHRRRKISDLLDSYIEQKKKECGLGYAERLGMPIYAIRESILDFIGKLHNKSVDIASITPQNFGSILPDDSRHELHQLLADIIPAVEIEYANELLDNNQIHLSSMMSLLNRFICNPDSKSRICELKKEKNVRQFMFVDEFQDTDDTQIEILMTLANFLDYKLFVVGDIKQCIYRFRGAKEKAFDQLHIDDHPDEWLQFSLQRNYRTDTALLDLYHRSFEAWGNRDDELLSYKSTDRLLGTRHYNSYLVGKEDKFYKRLPIQSEELRIPALANEIRRIQRRIEYEIQQGMKLSEKEKSIAILVRENWQADLVRSECARLGISVQTSTGGDLYMSQPALDMMTLVNALVHFDEADYLYNLVTSNFFNIDIPKSNLYEIRMKFRSEGWCTQENEREQSTYIIHLMNLSLANTNSKENTWEYIIHSLRTKPILQAVREIYSTLEPWKNYSTEPEKQHYYQLNVDLLFEQLINACNIDRLTINTLQEHLYNCIVSKVSVDSRTAPSDKNDVPIQCITVHKSKGLEFGHVILPYCSASISHIKKSQLHVSATKKDGQLQIGYSMNMGEFQAPIQNDYYDITMEKAEKSREETRILYVAMTRAIRSFSWIELQGKNTLSWQTLIGMEA